MFCSKCGKEIDDSAVVCVGCGCPTANYGSKPQSNAAPNNAVSPVTRTTVGSFNTPPTMNNTSYSEADKVLIPKIRQYISDVNTIFVLSIISIVLSLGIGIFFAILVFVKLKKLPQVGTSIEDPNLIADFQKAQKKLATATSIAAITILIFVIVVAIGFFAGIAG